MKYFYLIISLFSCLIISAQVPSNYYDSAIGMSGYTLKTELRDIITSGHVDQGYNSLWTGYATTDRDNYYENDNSILDMYSEKPLGVDSYSYTYSANQCGNYSGEGSCYNREHIVPQSSFGSASPMRNDIHQVFPTDGYVNGGRGSLPFAEVASPTTTYTNGSARGSSATTGYSGTVFEPIDEFKGDIARSLLYFAVRYQNTVNGYTSFVMFNGTQDQVFQPWAVDLLLAWNALDPVSQREIDRNNAAYNYQGNANPFINHPEYADLIWNPNPDITPPSTPTNLVASNPGSSTVDLTWTASTDNVGIFGYDIYVDGIYHASSNSSATNYTVTNLTSLTTYTFTILAKDASNNMSGLSASAMATTLDGPPTGTDCASETFELIPNNGSSYTTPVVWTGDDGIPNGWTATDARTDQTLTTKAIGIRNGTLTSPALAGGIGELTVSTMRVFSGGIGNFNLRVNGVIVGSIPYSDVVQTTTISNINIEGNVTISFTDKVSTSDRVVFDDLTWTCYAAPTNVLVSAKAYLQGAAINRSTVTGEEDWMRDDLRVNNVIPTTSPYDTSTCNASVFTTTGTDAIVDWIWLELRDAANNTTVIEGQSALIQRDGDIVAVDGTSSLSFNQAAGNYFIAIYHRNHLPIISANVIALSGTTSLVDFTDFNTQITAGTNAQSTVAMPVGIVAMWAGDANADGTIRYQGASNDANTIKDDILAQTGNSSNLYSYIGYHNADTNMDGSIRYQGSSNDANTIKDVILGHPSTTNSNLYSFSAQMP